MNSDAPTPPWGYGIIDWLKSYIIGYYVLEKLEKSVFKNLNGFKIKKNKWHSQQTVEQIILNNELREKQH